MLDATELRRMWEKPDNVYTKDVLIATIEFLDDMESEANTDYDRLSVAGMLRHLIDSKLSVVLEKLVTKDSPDRLK